MVLQSYNKLFDLSAIRHNCKGVSKGSWESSKRFPTRQPKRFLKATKITSRRRIK